MAQIKSLFNPRNIAQSFGRFLTEIKGFTFVTEEELGDIEEWQPSYSANGAMTFTGVATDFAQYAKLRTEIVWFSLRFSGTTGGVASTEIQFTLPVTPFLTPIVGPNFTAMVLDGAGNLSGTAAILNNSNIVAVYRQGGGNWGLGAGRTVLCNGVYRTLK